MTAIRSIIGAAIAMSLVEIALVRLIGALLDARGWVAVRSDAAYMRSRVGAGLHAGSSRSYITSSRAERERLLVEHVTAHANVCAASSRLALIDEELRSIREAKP